MIGIVCVNRSAYIRNVPEKVRRLFFKLDPTDVVEFSREISNSILCKQLAYLDCTLNLKGKNLSSIHVQKHKH